MTCPEATGTCTITPDGACTVPKTEGVFDPITGVIIGNFEDTFTVTWNAAPGDTDTINVLYRQREDLTFYPREFYTRSDGGFTSQPVSAGEIVLAMRPESATEYGEWQVFQFATTDNIIPSYNFSLTDNSQYIGIL